MESERKKTGLGGWLFLLFVLVAYGVIGIVNFETVSQALSFFVKVMHNVLPALVGVFFLLLAADLLFEPKWIQRHLGKGTSIKGWAIAVVGGVLASGPIYAWYALLRELREKGLSASLAAVFLYSRAVKMPLLPLMVHYFGMAYTFVLCFYLLGFAIVSGLFMARLDDHDTH